MKSKVLAQVQETARYLVKATSSAWAMPMTLGDYNTYRGWQIPSDESPASTGYLLEFVDSPEEGRPHGHLNRITWVSTEHFRSNYTAEALPHQTAQVKVAPALIEKLMGSLTFKYERVGQTNVTGCWSFLPNGWKVAYGESSCVDPNEFNFDDGKKYAKENCLVASRNKLWEHEGYTLKMTGKTSDGHNVG